MSLATTPDTCPFVADILTETIEVPINLNGSLHVRVPRDMDARKVNEIATQLLNDILSQIVAGHPARQGVTLESVDGECWVNEGQVLVGELAFEVDHDTARGTSCATVDLVPEEQAFGAHQYHARVTTVTEKNQVAITATNPRTGIEEPLVVVNIDHGDVVVHLWDRQGGDPRHGGPAASVRRAGLVAMRH